jgi:hypothetical protein
VNKSLFYLPLFFLLTLVSCYEPIEGCLDVEAVNFDVTADKNCCCTYPALTLSVSQGFDTQIWFADSAYQNNLGQWFKLKKATWYFSEFALTQNGNTLSVTDTVQLKTLNGIDTLEQAFTDDFILVRRSPVLYSIGDFRTSGAFDRIQFRLGLSEDARKILPSSALSSHPLAPQTEEMWRGIDTSYAAIQLIIQKDTLSSTIPDTLYFTRYDFDNFMIEESSTFIHETGFDFNVNLKINYLALFENVNWQNGDKSSWKSQIVANLPGAFTVSQ